MRKAIGATKKLRCKCSNVSKRVFFLFHAVKWKMSNLNVSYVQGAAFGHSTKCSREKKGSIAHLLLSCFSVEAIWHEAHLMPHPNSLIWLPLCEASEAILPTAVLRKSCTHFICATKFSAATCCSSELQTELSTCQVRFLPFSSVFFFFFENYKRTKIFTGWDVLKYCLCDE